jgi:hypothetical protein
MSQSWRPVMATSCGTPQASKVAWREVAHLDRVVDQFVVVGRRVKAEAMAFGLAAPSRRAPPAVPWRRASPCSALPFRRLDIDKAGRFLLSDHAQEGAGAVEEGVRLVKVRAAHREIPGIDLDDDRQRCRLFQ